MRKSGLSRDKFAQFAGFWRAAADFVNPMGQYGVQKITKREANNV
jgi:hypothetical protein